MPYIASGKCVYKKKPDGSRGEKVGCTEGPIEDYLAALRSSHKKANEAKEPKKKSKKIKVRMVKKHKRGCVEAAGLHGMSSLYRTSRQDMPPHRQETEDDENGR